MVVVDIDIIHGDHLVTQSGELSEKTVDRFSSSLSQLWELHQGAQAIALKPIGGRSVIQITYPDNTILLDAQNGESLAPLDELAANRLAMSYYAGSGEIRKSSLIETNPPREIGARTLPLWRIDFGDVWGTTLYISPTTGELATRRHTLWRIFDFVWMLHIMDYDEREDINNMLLRLVSFFAFLLVLSGVWYLYFRLNMKSWFTKVNS